MVSFVQYQYPDEETQQVEGDNFDFDVEYINTTLWQATGEADVLIEGPYNAKTGWFTRFLFSEKQGQISKGDITTWGGGKIGESWLFGDKSLDVHPGLVGEWWTTPNGVVPPSTLYDSRRQFLRHFAKHQLSDPEPRYYYDNPVFKHWHPVNGDRQTTFTITLEKKVQFTRIEINKDLVFVRIIQGKQCPKNSCVVSCGDKICCYSPAGISIDSFLKEESIY